MDKNNNTYENILYEIPDALGRTKLYKVFFSDDEQTIYAKSIKEILVYNGEIIDGIKFIYSDGIGGKAHGNSSTKCNRLVLENNEYITQISWSTIFMLYYGGQVLSNISFQTNLNRKLEVFGELRGLPAKPYKYECNGTQKIVGLQGYAHRYINAITHVICRNI